MILCTAYINWAPEVCLLFLSWEFKKKSIAQLDFQTAEGLVILFAKKPKLLISQTEIAMI